MNIVLVCKKNVGFYKSLRIRAGDVKKFGARKTFEFFDIFLKLLMGVCIHNCNCVSYDIKYYNMTISHIFFHCKAETGIHNISILVMPQKTQHI